MKKNWKIKKLKFRKIDEKIRLKNQLSIKISKSNKLTIVDYYKKVIIYKMRKLLLNERTKI